MNSLKLSNGRISWLEVLRTFWPVIVIGAMVIMWITGRVETPQVKVERIDTRITIHDGNPEAHPQIRRDIKHYHDDFIDLREEMREEFKEVKQMIKDAHDR